VGGAGGWCGPASGWCGPAGGADPPDDLDGTDRQPLGPAMQPTDRPQVKQDAAHPALAISLP
jgi:hypothetical protein